MNDDTGNGTRGRLNWKKLHPGLKVLAAIVVLFAAYTAFGFLAVPPIIESKLDSSLESALNRSVDVGEVSFNPFSLKMDVAGIEIARKDAGGALVSLESLHLNMEYFSLIEFAPVIGELRLVRPNVHLVYGEDGTYNVSDLVSDGGGDDGDGGGMLHFVLQSFVVEQGRVVFEDRAMGKSHVVEKLELDIPFASTLPEDSDQPVQPTLDAVVNGTPVSLEGKALPFADPLRAEFDIEIEGSNLTHYWAYAPLPDVVGLESGTFSCDAALVFEQGENILPRLYFRGSYTLRDVAMTGRNGTDILGFESLELELEEVGVFDRMIRAKTMKVASPYAFITRLENGRLDWPDYLPTLPKDAAANATRRDDGNDETRTALHLEAQQLNITGGRVGFRDLAVPGGFQYELSPIWLSAENVNTKDRAPARLTATFGDEGKERISVSADFGVLPLQAEGDVTISGVDPGDFQVYYRNILPLAFLDGSMGGRFEFRVPEGDVRASAVESFGVDLTDLVLATAEAQEPQIEVPLLNIRGGSLAPSKRAVEVEEVAVENATVRLTRRKDGTIDLRAGPDAKDEGRKREEQGASESEKWDLSVRTARVSGADFALTDNAAPRPGRIELEGVNATLSDFRPEKGQRMPVTLSASSAAGGGLSLQGEMIWPGDLSGDLTVDGLSLVPLNAYIPFESSLRVAECDLNAKGRVEVDGDADKTVRFDGGVDASDLRLEERNGGEKIASLHSLEMTGVRAEGAPFAVRLDDVKMSGLDALYGVSPDGKSNLAGVLAGFGDEDEGQEGEELNRLTIGTITLADGKLRIVDESVDPTFETTIAELGAEFEGLALSPKEKSRVRIRATIGGSAPLSANGTLNVMEAGAGTDLDVRIENMSLPPLTPYSTKYISYPITKGKLYADVALSIHDLILNAQSRFRIEQLAIGEKVESEAAVDVPVQLAMSLLTDGSGTMTLDVPVKGDLDDPQFKLGKVVFRAVGSMFGKIVTAPFSFLGAIFGGDDAPQNVDVLEFAAGSSEFAPRHERKLDTIARAMAERPGIRLELSGYADPDADGAALEKERLRERAREQKIENMGDKAPEDPADIELTQDEYRRYLEAAYRDAVNESPGDMTIGEMERALRQYVTVTEDDLRRLAKRRSAAVRDYLTGVRGVEPGRIYIEEHDPLAEPEEDAARSRVELGLSG